MADSPWIETDPAGGILHWSADAPPLTGFARHLRGRSLPILLIHNRPDPALLLRVTLGHPVEREGVMRPRNHGGVRVRYRIELAPDSTDRQPLLRWTFQHI